MNQFIQPHRVSPWKLLASILALIIGTGMIVTAWLITSKKQEEIVQSKHREETGQREEFFKRDILPLLDSEKDLNRVALAHAKQLLDEKFSTYSARVPRFVDELMSWSSKYKITKAILTDKWYGSTETREYVTELYSANVMSDADLKKDLRTIVRQFHSDLEANRNWMLSQAIQRIETSHVPVPKAVANPSSLTTEFNREFSDLLETRAKQVPEVAVLAIGGSILAEEGTRMLVTAAIRILIVELIATTGTAGGATATATTAAGGGGTVLAPGVGTAIGIAVGLIVGVAIDWWMESRFAVKMTAECRDTLNKMETKIWGGKNGLEAELASLVDISRETQEQALRLVIVGGAK